MPDIFSRRKRSAVMAAIRSRGNRATELRLIAIFRAHGITGWRRGCVIRGQETEDGDRKSEVRERKSGAGRQKAEPGRRANEGKRTVRFAVRPDFVFPKLTHSTGSGLGTNGRVAVFVDGCFWHGCPIHGTKPKQNAAFWRRKIAANRARDRLVTRTLRAMGWRVLRVWEHELARKNERRLLKRLRGCF
jgi:DNA mismatch endonuclease (patch repair protein)